jgi:hypothetical protein
MWTQWNLWTASCKDKLYSKIKKKQQQKYIHINRMNENHPRMNIMAHEDENCRPQE